MQRQAQAREESIKQLWFDSPGARSFGNGGNDDVVKCLDADKSNIEAYRAILYNLSEMTFEGYEQLKDDLNEHQRH